MSAIELLARLDAMGVELNAENGRLRVSAARGSLDDTLRQDIAAHKSELMALLAGRKRHEAPMRVSRAGTLPLSFFQERLWVLQRLDPQNTAYLLEAHWHAPSGVDAAQLQAAVARVHARHEGLHVAFTEEGGEPRARVVEVPPVALHDLSALDPVEQKRCFAADIERAVHTPIDLARDPVARFAVYRLQDGVSAVMLCAHHIALDAWSIQLVMREIAAELQSDRAASIQPSELQYADYADWQRRTQNPLAIAGELDWWAETLKDAPQLSAFPSDRSIANQPSGTSLDFEWDDDFSEELRNLVREEGATVYMALLAACAALLRVHTGQREVVLGSPMGIRERPEFESLVGPFVNLMVVRLDLGDDPSFAELLRRARDAMLDAHAHRQVPFEMLVERLKPARSFEHSPLFQVAVVQHNAASSNDLSISSGGALHELTWFVRENGRRFACSLEYRSDLYSQALIARLASQLQQFLRAAIADRHCPSSRLSLLTESQRQQLLHAFNASTQTVESAAFSRQFERQAAATPDRVAACFEGQVIGYAELNRGANRLAHRLRELGVKPGALVGICLDRSLELLTALLAVHKAGGAYVPLDPGFPAERLAFMLDDSGAKVLLTFGEASASIDVPSGITVVDPRTEASRELAGGDDDPDPIGSPEDPAYVIYTSGSTGRPKGVAVPHRALSNFLGSMRRVPGLDAADVVAAVTTISFDIAGLELFLPLVVGARVELVSRDTASDGVALARHLAGCDATVLQATPATWRLLIEAGWQPVRPLRALCGGEALPRDLADALLVRVAELWNLYGPTETTIWSTVERVTHDGLPITIGRPIANTQVYVLDPAGEILPIGVAGELWIGGEGVALGYHRRPELTAERFVPDRFSSRAGARLYRTGDLAKWNEDGRLVHLGRLDQQVKIRGFRIELGEIESALGTHSAVRQVLVMAREAAPGDLRLVAYIVFHDGEDLTASDVRRHLRRDLPEYMIPSLVVALQAMPLTPNGKIDRHAVPDPFRDAVRGTVGHEPPAPGHEEALARIWCEVLKLDRVSALDNFFDLGGHSLLSLRVVTAIERLTGRRVDPRQLFFQNLRQVAMAMAAAPPQSEAT